MDQQQHHQDHVLRRKAERKGVRLNDSVSEDLRNAIDKTKKKIVAAFADGKKVRATLKETGASLKR